MNIILLGPPGVGKGTNATYLAKRLKLLHVSTGDIFRQAIEQDTPLGNQVKNYLDMGRLVPDAVVTEVVKARLAQKDAQKGFILDGYPRNLEQAKALDGFAKIELVINLSAPYKILLDRMAGRRVCSKCGKVYHLTHAPPKKSEKCDACSSDLVQRSDETPDVVRKRLQVYEELTTPLADYYRNEGLVHEIDASFNLDEFSKIELQYDEMLEELKEDHGRKSS